MAREGLSARLDGERAPVSAASLDEHLRTCPACTAWCRSATQLRAFQSHPVEMADAGDGGFAELTASLARGNAERSSSRRVIVTWLRLIAVIAGIVLVAIGSAQSAGAQFGLVGVHTAGMSDGGHLMHESTALVLACGIATIAAAFWRPLRAGVTMMLGAYSICLLAFLARDFWDGEVTVARAATHIPIAVSLLVSAALTAYDRA